MSKKRLMIFPFDTEIVPLINNSDILNEYDLTSIVSPSGWGINLKNLIDIDYQSKKLDLEVKNNFYSELQNIDVVLLNNSILKLDYETEIKPAVLYAMDCKKDIICFINIGNADKLIFSEKSNENGVDFKYFGDGNRSIKNPTKFDNEKDVKYYDFNTSIVLVMGMTENTNKFAVQLDLRRKFIEDGYKVSQIGSRNYCEFLGFHSFPPFMFDNTYKDYEKIVLFNNFIKNMEREEEPDVIIIGVPGGVLPINNKFTNKFGITSFQVGQAVKADATVFCTHFDNFKIEYFDNILPILKYRFSSYENCFYINNSVMDFLHTDMQNEISIVDIDRNKVTNQINSFDNQSYHIYTDFSDTYNYVKTMLLSYAQTMSL